MQLTRATLIAAIWIALASASVAFGQEQRYSSPAGPTISPYLDYFRRVSGLLDRHHAFVRPEIRRRQTFAELQQTVGRQRNQLGRLNRQIEELRETNAAPTGTGSRFMNYSHYYQLTPTQR